jgi:5-methylcytosine-specific restriction endonuclease McrA
VIKNLSNCIDHQFIQHPKFESLCLICHKRYNALKAREGRSRAVKLFNDYKVNTGCVKCGYNEHFAALEFDHIIPVKLGFKRAGIKKTKASLEKIINDPNVQVLCAICHRIKTWENGDYKNNSNAPKSDRIE